MKPCPFCGRPAEGPAFRPSMWTPTGEFWTMSCFGGEYSAHVWIHGNTRDECIANWNTRAPDRIAPEPTP